MDTIYFGVINLLVFAVIIIATRRNGGAGASSFDLFDLHAPDPKALPGDRASPANGLDNPAAHHRNDPSDRPS